MWGHISLTSKTLKAEAGGLEVQGHLQTSLPGHMGQGDLLLPLGFWLVGWLVGGFIGWLVDEFCFFGLVIHYISGVWVPKIALKFLLL